MLFIGLLLDLSFQAFIEFPTGPQQVQPNGI